MITSNNQIILPCNSRKKEECLLEVKCRANEIVYKCRASKTDFPNKVYLKAAKESKKKRLYNYNTSLKNESKRNNTTLEKYSSD